MTLYEIPLGPSQRTMTIALGAKVYGLRFAFADAPDAGWFMDISDVPGNRLIAGLPLVAGLDMLQPYPDLGIAGSLYLVSDTGADPLSYDNLGVSWHLLFVQS